MSKYLASISLADQFGNVCLVWVFFSSGFALIQFSMVFVAFRMVFTIFNGFVFSIVLLHLSIFIVGFSVFHWFSSNFNDVHWFSNGFRLLSLVVL